MNLEAVFMVGSMLLTIGFLTRWGRGQQTPTIIVTPPPPVAKAEALPPVPKQLLPPSKPKKAKR